MSLQRDGVQLWKDTVVAGSEADQWQGKNELIIMNKYCGNYISDLFLCVEMLLFMSVMLTQQ